MRNSGWHALLMGSAFHHLEPESVALFESRGYESPSSKAYMRWSVVLSELVVFFPAVLCAARVVSRLAFDEGRLVQVQLSSSSFSLLLLPLHHIFPPCFLVFFLKKRKIKDKGRKKRMARFHRTPGEKYKSDLWTRADDSCRCHILDSRSGCVQPSTDHHRPRPFPVQ